MKIAVIMLALLIVPAATPLVAQQQSSASLASSTMKVCLMCAHDLYPPGDPDMCLGVEIGYYGCDSGVYYNGEHWCQTFGAPQCIFPQAYGDGSARIASLDGLSDEALAVLLGGVPGDAALRRPCDGTIVARHVEPEVGQQQRVETSLLVL